MTTDNLYDDDDGDNEDDDDEGNDHIIANLEYRIISLVLLQ